MKALSTLTICRSRWGRIKASLTPAEWRRAAVLAAIVVGLHVVGFFLLLVVVVPHHYRVGAGGVFGLGVGITAYTLGLRHAFDADHIAAIDNTTRKLMNEGQRPLSVGFFFSLGHSSIVFALGVLVTIGVRGLDGAVADRSSTLHKATGLLGPVVSGSFLLLIGILNLIVLVSILGIFRRMRHGHFDEAELEEQLNHRGVMNRFYGRATRAVKKPWHMYPLGCLFGLGFDTATEVALLVLAGGAAAGGLPFYAIVCLPILFAAGMSLFDTIDGAFMNFAYGWAFAQPVRKIFFNLTITGLSVAVALLIGGLELLSVLADKLKLTGGIWGFAANLDLNVVGYAIVGLFLITWILALAVWRFARIEERWNAAAAAASR
ncbi:HoxN/HupN/NixA family nickel/cobalt transporter [Solirubrobacter ginsenosidimutans]|uniref:Nickel/cobalt efflux system n=1 Tax=Solirubrobacter ginsenosidimutans TaxID=490573 RepID=A0A9X3MVM7_9ACTN|nr:HoxN/HupN/NixA family nickel/cobalt transporter [Solirubrobacter ginsenosidimutans]MDA0162611.1 HoxN/HupN/NixA family nickel/cobalt transporter [Solirubrobacter ginsenosidimutans]